MSRVHFDVRGRLARASTAHVPTPDTDRRRSSPSSGPTQEVPDWGAAMQMFDDGPVPAQRLTRAGPKQMARSGT